MGRSKRKQKKESVSGKRVAKCNISYQTHILVSERKSNIAPIAKFGIAGDF